MNQTVGESTAILRKEAHGIRRLVIEMAHAAGSGHCGGSLSCVEILLTLYRRILRVRAAEPDWPERDRLVLSKGHAAPTLYAILARMGFFPTEQLLCLRQFGSTLQGHPDMRKLSGVEISTGSLGMGISNGIGMAWTARHRQKDWRAFVVVGDGELDEGQNWEAAMLAVKLQLDNLVVVVDHNRVQLDGPTDQIMPLGSIAEKFGAFGWGTLECNGHDCQSLEDVLQVAARASRPTAVVAHTIKGKGISFMEGNSQWHGAPLGEAEYKSAIAELEGSHS
jgi:transketolase